MNEKDEVYEERAMRTAAENERDAIKAKMGEEIARLKVQLREVTERLSMEGKSFAQNVRDETQDGAFMRNVRENKWWVVGAVVLIIVVVVAYYR